MASGVFHAEEVKDTFATRPRLCSAALWCKLHVLISLVTLGFSDRHCIPTQSKSKLEPVCAYMRLWYFLFAQYVKDFCESSIHISYQGTLYKSCTETELQPRHENTQTFSRGLCHVLLILRVLREINKGKEHAFQNCSVHLTLTNYTRGRSKI